MYQMATFGPLQSSGGWQPQILISPIYQYTLQPTTRNLCVFKNLYMKEFPPGKYLTMTQYVFHRVDVAKVSTSPGERLKPKKRRLLPLASSMPPLQLELGEVAPDVAAEVTFREVLC